MKKRLIVCLLALAMLLSMAACGQDTPATEPDNTEGQVQQTNAPAAPVTLASGGATEFRIIYPESASEEVRRTVDYLTEQLAQLTGAQFKAMEDMAVSSSDEALEILVGNTDRDESSEAIGNMSGSGDYIVRVDGSKIVLVGMLDMGVQQAAEKLIADLTAMGSSDLTLAGDYVVNGTSDSPVQHLPVYSYGTLQTSYDCGDGVDMLIYESDETGFASYGADLVGAGFVKYTENTIGQNQFATYTKDNVMVHTMSLPAMECVRIIAQENAVLPAAAPDPVNAVVTPSITMLGLEGYDTDTGSANQIGMSFLYQLSDGSFIIVDGGHKNATAAGQLYQTMAELAPDPGNITIAAWFITHAHWDHMGALFQFSADYAGKVTVEKLICNLPNDAEMDGGSETSSENRYLIYDSAETLGAQIVKAYTGQVLYIRDAVVEVICGVEVIAPQSFEYYNNSCMIFTVELGGQKIMQLADCGPLQSPVLTYLYGAELKSDIVQNGHHGYSGATSELYRAIDADYMLWPGGSNAFQNYKDMDYNTWVVANVENTWVARDEIVTLQLPIT